MQRLKRVGWFVLLAPLLYSILSFMDMPAASGFTSLNSPENPSFFFLAYVCGLVVAALGMAAFARRGRAYISSVVCAIFVAVGVGLSFSYSVTAYGFPAQIPVGGFLIGMATVMALAGWSRVYTTLSSADATFALGVSLCVAYLAKLAMGLAVVPGDSASSLIPSGALLLSVVPLERLANAGAHVSGEVGETSLAELAPAEPRASFDHMRGALAGAVLCMLLVGVSWGETMHGAAPGTASLAKSSVLVAGKTLGALAACVCLARAAKAPTVKRAYMPTVAALLLCGWFLSDMDDATVAYAGALVTGAGMGAAVFGVLWSLHFETRGQARKASLLACGLSALMGAGILVGMALPWMLPAGWLKLVVPVLIAAFLATAAILDGFSLPGDAQEGTGQGVGESTIAPASTIAAPAVNAALETNAPAEPAALAVDYAKARFQSLSSEWGLSPREQEVFELLAQGHSATYIAEQLVVSPYTVKTHIKRIYAKADVHSKDELIAKVSDFGA